MIIDASTAQAREDVKKYIDSLPDDTCTIEIKKGKAARTALQGRSIHKYCRDLSDALNDAGITRAAAMKETTDCAWSMDAVKVNLWHPIQLALFGTESTAKLNKKQVSEVYENLNLFTCEKFGLSVYFPNRFFIEEQE